MRSFDLPELDHLTTGTVGPPGHRVFYLQVGAGASVVSLRLEKAQVAELVRYLSRVLADLPPPAEAHAPMTPPMALVEPVIAEWVVGTLGVSYDEVDDRIILVAEELVTTTGDDDEDDEYDEDAEHGIARLRATRAQIGAFVTHGRAIVEAGRPTCSLCGNPIDPEGHACPRLNGHRQPAR